MEMATAVTLDELSDILECAICLETVENPKLLTCNHSYCKRCIDGLVQFRPNGSAVIKCPKACTDLTVITEKQTTNDLGVDYMMKQILDMMSTKEKQHDDTNNFTCESAQDCSRNAHVYCVTCNSFSCNTCSINHDTCQLDSPVIPITFDHQNSQLTVLCKEHGTEAAYICCNNELICLYCLHRVHRGHPHVRLDNQVALLKKMLTREIDQMESFMEGIKLNLHDTEVDISTSKVGLEKCLKEMKIKCVNNYLDYLNQEEEQIMKEFDSIATHHIEKFFISDPTLIYKEYLTKEDIKIALQIKAITNSMKGLEKEKMKSIQDVTVSLNDFNLKHPLGYLGLTLGEAIPVNKAKKTFTCKLPCVTDTSEKLLQDMKQSCQGISEDMIKKLNINEYNQTRGQDFPTDCSLQMPVGGTSDQLNEANTEYTGVDMVPDYFSSFTHVSKTDCVGGPAATIVKKDNEMLNKCLKKFEDGRTNYIEDLIKTGMNTELIILLRERPEIFYLRSDNPPFRNRPIHMAAKYNNLTFLKELIYYDESMLDFKNHIGSNALHAAVSYESAYDCFDWLIETYPDILEIKNHNGYTPLHIACGRQVAEAVKLLLSKGVSICEMDNFGNTPLETAEQYNFYDIVEMLSKHI